MLSDSAKSALTSQLWAAAVHRMSPRYMGLLIMDKNLNEFLKTKANSVLLMANLFHLPQDARKSENRMHFLIGHNSVCVPLHTSTHGVLLNFRNMIVGQPWILVCWWSQTRP